MARSSRPADERAFDLAELREARRLLKRGLRKLDEIERAWLRSVRADRPAKPSADEREAAHNAYCGCSLPAVECANLRLSRLSVDVEP